MKIGRLKSSSARSELLNALLVLQNGLYESVDTEKGYSFYRGMIFSDKLDDDIIHLNLLGADSEGRFRVVTLNYYWSKDALAKPVDRGIVNEEIVCRVIRLFVESLSSFSVSLSTVYFDFNSNFDIGAVKCFLYEDLNEVGSNVLMVEADPGMVDTYMLRDAFYQCRGTMLCGKFSRVYSVLHNLDPTNETQRNWLEGMGVRLA